MLQALFRKMNLCFLLDHCPDLALEVHLLQRGHLRLIVKCGLHMYTFVILSKFSRCGLNSRVLNSPEITVITVILIDCQLKLICSAMLPPTGKLSYWLEAFCCCFFVFFYLLHSVASNWI